MLRSNNRGDTEDQNDNPQEYQIEIDKLQSHWKLLNEQRVRVFVEPANKSHIGFRVNPKEMKSYRLSFR